MKRRLVDDGLSGPAYTGRGQGLEDHSAVYKPHLAPYVNEIDCAVFVVVAALAAMENVQRPGDHAVAKG
jgi:hypothetical protein